MKEVRIISMQHLHTARVFGDLVVKVIKLETLHHKFPVAPQYQRNIFSYMENSGKDLNDCRIKNSLDNFFVVLHMALMSTHVEKEFRLTALTEKLYLDRKLRMVTKQEACLLMFICRCPVYK